MPPLLRAGLVQLLGPVDSRRKGEDLAIPREGLPTYSSGEGPGAPLKSPTERVGVPLGDKTHETHHVDLDLVSTCILVAVKHKIQRFTCCSPSLAVSQKTPARFELAGLTFALFMYICIREYINKQRQVVSVQ